MQLAKVSSPWKTFSERAFSQAIFSHTKTFDTSIHIHIQWWFATSEGSAERRRHIHTIRPHLHRCIWLGICRVCATLHNGLFFYATHFILAHWTHMSWSQRCFVYRLVRRRYPLATDNTLHTSSDRLCIYATCVCTNLHACRNCACTFIPHRCTRWKHHRGSSPRDNTGTLSCKGVANSRTTSTVHGKQTDKCRSRCVENSQTRDANDSFDFVVVSHLFRSYVRENQNCRRCRFGECNSHRVIRNRYRSKHAVTAFGVVSVCENPRSISNRLMLSDKENNGRCRGVVHCFLCQTAECCA